MKRAGKKTLAHKKACRLYREWFIEEYDYVHCLSVNCKDANKPPHAPHHIFYASRYPSHKMLHNRLNMIMLCADCHSDFHGAKRKEEYEQLVIERGLNKLFTSPA